MMWALCEFGICPWSIALSRQAPRHGGGEGTQWVLSGYSGLLSGYSSEYSSTHTVRIRVLSEYLDHILPFVLDASKLNVADPTVRAVGSELTKY